MLPLSSRTRDCMHLLHAGVRIISKVPKYAYLCRAYVFRQGLISKIAYTIDPSAVISAESALVRIRAEAERLEVPVSLEVKRTWLCSKSGRPRSSSKANLLEARYKVRVGENRYQENYKKWVFLCFSLFDKLLASATKMGRLSLFKNLQVCLHFLVVMI